MSEMEELVERYQKTKSHDAALMLARHIASRIELMTDSGYQRLRDSVRYFREKDAEKGQHPMARVLAQALCDSVLKDESMRKALGL